MDRAGARHAGQDLHHLIAGTRCSVCRWSPRVPRRSRDASFFCRTARNCATSRRASGGSRSGRRIAIPRPFRRRGTVCREIEVKRGRRPRAGDARACLPSKGAIAADDAGRRRYDRYNIHQETHNTHETIIRTHARG